MLAPQHAFPQEVEHYTPCEEPGEPFMASCANRIQHDEGHPVNGSACMTPTDEDPNGSIETISNLADCAERPDAELTVYPGADHDSWTRTYTIEAGHDIYEWLLSHSRT